MQRISMLAHILDAHGSFSSVLVINCVNLIKNKNIDPNRPFSIFGYVAIYFEKIREQVLFSKCHKLHKSAIVSKESNTKINFLPKTI